MHLWSKEKVDLGPVFLWAAKDVVVVYLLLVLWQQYPALQSSETNQVLGAAALLTTVYSGVLAIAQSGPVAVLTCAAMSQLGVVFQGLAVGSAAAVWGGLFLLVSRSVSILLASSAVAAMPHVIVGESESGIRPSRWRSLLVLTGFAVGVMVMLGVPPLGSFDARRQIHAALHATHPFLAWAWVLSAVGIALGVIRTVRLLWHAEAAPSSTSMRNLPLLPVMGLLWLCLSIELYPQKVLALLSDSFASLLPL
jgi:formate hydrogenlyase subunit 3/multisubunit Na+/H+ antiporter MnhD subunit